MKKKSLKAEDCREIDLHDLILKLEWKPLKELPVQITVIGSVSKHLTYIAQGVAPGST